MENKKSRFILLLPGYFKKLGITIMIVAFVAAIIIKMTHSIMTPSQRDIYKIMLSDIFTLGLLFITLSKDKTEDERTSLLRLISLNNTFVGIVVYVLISPLISLISGELTEMSALSVINLMMLMYLVNYYGRKEFN